MIYVYKTGFIRKIMTNTKVDDMIGSIIKWANDKYIHVEDITPKVYKKEFPEINDWEKDDQKQLNNGLVQWLADEPQKVRKNRRGRNNRHAAKIATAKKDTVELTPEQAAAKEAAAKERERETDNAGKKRQHEADALDIMDSGVSKKAKVTRSPEEEEKLRKMRERDSARRLAQKAAKALEIELDIATGGEAEKTKKPTIELDPKAAAKARKNQKDKERRKKQKIIKDRVKSLDLHLNPRMHYLLQKIADPDDENVPECILVQELEALAMEQQCPFVDRNHYQEWISEKFKCFDPRRQVNTRFMVENFPISDTVVENVQDYSQQVAACTSALSDNVSDSSRESDGSIREQVKFPISDKVVENVQDCSQQVTAGTSALDQVKFPISDMDVENVQDCSQQVAAGTSALSDNVSNSSCQSNGSSSPQASPRTPWNSDYEMSDANSDIDSDSSLSATPRTPRTPGDYGDPYESSDSLEF
jgi:hypothetical protein